MDPESRMSTSRSMARQSLSHVSANATTDIAALQRAQDGQTKTKKKSRGRSIGPGGLEALTESSGNAMKVLFGTNIWWNARLTQADSSSRAEIYTQTRHPTDPAKSYSIF